MIQFKSDHGDITVSSAVFSNITGMAATNCFGVKGMAYRSMTDGLVHLLRREAMSKGVSITYHDDNSISIELHIIVENGVNLPAVCRSIMNEVRYVVTRKISARRTGVSPLDGYSLYLSWTRATVSSRVSGLGSGGACARRLLLLM